MSHSDQEFDILFGHNYYDYGKPQGGPCFATQNKAGEWTWCGGYQPWMDEYVPRATHLIMVAEPMSRMASMYYYEQGYTKLKVLKAIFFFFKLLFRLRCLSSSTLIHQDRLPSDLEYGRLNEQERFMDPKGEVMI